MTTKGNLPYYNEFIKNSRKLIKHYKEIGAIPNNGKKYCLHHWDIHLRKKDPKRYSEVNPYDVDVVEYGEHSRIHNKKGYEYEV